MNNFLKQFNDNDHDAKIIIEYNKEILFNPKMIIFLSLFSTSIQLYLMP